MFVTYDTVIPENLKKFLFELGKLSKFKLFLSKRSFDNLTLSHIFRYIMNYRDSIRNNETYIDNIMKYTVNAEEYNQVQEILDLISTIYEFFEDREDILELVINEYNEVRSAKEIYEISRMFESSFTKEQIQRVLKYFDYTTSTNFEIVKKLVYVGMDDEIIEKLLQIRNFDYPMDINMTFLADAHDYYSIRKKDILFCMEHLNLNPDYFVNIVYAILFRLDDDKIDEIVKMCYDEEPVSFVNKSRSKYCFEEITKHIDLDLFECDHLEYILLGVENGLTLKEILSYCDPNLDIEIVKSKYNYYLRRI